MQAQAGIDPADAQSRARRRRSPWSRTFGSARFVIGTLLFALSLTAYLVDQAVHRHAVLSWYDLNVYNDAGLITRQLPAILYTWELKVGIQFTYTPFAALIFSGGSMLKFSTLRWIMTSASLAAIPLTAWLTLGGMGKRRAWLAAALAVSALALWIQPVSKALFLGQIEPLLMLLVVWDLTRSDERRWKGIGIGLAAGIKLVPLIFIPYLLLAGKIRQALVATATFAATIVLGFLTLPGPSASYWLTGYFMRPGRTGSVHSLVNQSLLGLIARLYGTVGPAQGAWVPLALAVAVCGVVAGAMLSRARPASSGLGPGRHHERARLADQLGPPLGVDRAVHGPASGSDDVGQAAGQGRLRLRHPGRGGRHGRLAVALQRPACMGAQPGPARLVHQAAPDRPGAHRARVAVADLEPVGRGRERDLPGPAGDRDRRLAAPEAPGGRDRRPRRRQYGGGRASS